jgi:hypothetical protein
MALLLIFARRRRPALVTIRFIINYRNRYHGWFLFAFFNDLDDIAIVQRVLLAQRFQYFFLKSSLSISPKFTDIRKLIMR